MAAKDGRYQITGDKHPLGGGAVESPSANPKSGQFQKVGTEIGMGKNSIQSPSANPASGQFQKIGDEMSLSRKGVHGWGSAANLTMSNRSHRQDDNVAQRGGRGKRK